MSFLDWRIRKSRIGFLYVIEHLVLSNQPGNHYNVLRYKNGAVRYFWTQAEAEKRANLLNHGRP